MVSSLVDRYSNFARYVIEKKAEEESRVVWFRVRVRPNFIVKLPPKFMLKKEVGEWIKDWKELDYILPHENFSNLDQTSAKMERRGCFKNFFLLNCIRSAYS